MDIDRLLKSSGLIDFIDDAYLVRDDFRPTIEAFVASVQEAERKECAKLCDEEMNSPRNSWKEQSIAGNLAEAIRARASN